jgi:hypothetical protein
MKKNEQRAVAAALAIGAASESNLESAECELSHRSGTLPPVDLG